MQYISLPCFFLFTLFIVNPTFLLGGGGGEVRGLCLVLDAFCCAKCIFYFCNYLEEERELVALA